MKMTCKEELVKSLKQTSVKGVPRWFKVDSLNLKVLWALAIVGFLAAGIYQTYELLAEYFSYPKMTYIEEHSFDIEDYIFPNVQVCNVNSMGLLRNAPQNESFDYYQKLADDITTCATCSEEEKDLLMKVRGDYISAYGYIGYVGADKVVKLMKDYKDFLIECLVFKMDSFTGEECTSLATIEIIPSFDYLLCLRVKFPKNELIDKVSMTFYADNFENDLKQYNSKNIWSVKSSGVVYYIYENDTDNVLYGPRPTAPPGIMTTVNINKELHTRLPDPYGNCIEKENHTYDGCIDKCLKESILEKCKCISPADFETKPTQDLHTCLPITSSRDKLLESQNCTYSTKRPNAKYCSSVCQENCHETKYITHVSTSRWPLPHQYASFYHQLIKSKPYSEKFKILASGTSNMTKEEIISNTQLVEENFVKIDFLINNKAYLEFKQVPKYTTFSFIGTLGGALNLWTGITVVVLMEIIELIVNITNSMTKERPKDSENNHI